MGRTLPLLLAVVWLGCPEGDGPPAGDDDVSADDDAAGDDDGGDDDAGDDDTGDDDSDWVAIAGGEFAMGSEQGDWDEMPVHVVGVPDFEMQRTEVTVAHYAECVAQGACTVPASGDEYHNWDAPGREQHPVNAVDWYQALHFCDWFDGRLPTEAEWEYAARSGGLEVTYPWGDEFATCDYAVMDEGTGAGCGAFSTLEVCSIPAGNTEQGLCDMAGNVWEWVQDWYHPDYLDAPSDGSAWEDPEGADRVKRGGSFDFPGPLQRTTNRYYAYPPARHINLGFRCAR